MPPATTTHRPGPRHGARPVAAPSAARRERVEVAGWRSLWAAAPEDLAARHGLTATTIGGGLCLSCASGSGSAFLNRVVGLGTGVPVSASDLDAMERLYAPAGLRYVVAVGAPAAGLRRRLEARGFTDDRPWMTFHRPAGDAPEPASDLRVRAAGPSEAVAFGGIVAAGFALPPEMSAWFAALVGRPGWTCLLAWDGRVPVGAAAMFAHGDTAWITLGATLPEHRGRGAQSLLFAARATRARRLGLRHLVTETGAPVGDEGPGPSYRNMLRAGFREVALRPNLASPAPA